MTKSAITRERLEWLSQISCRDDIEDIGGDEIRELASMALAAMDSEPVAYTEKHEISNMHATGLYLRAWPADRARNAVEGYTIPLYRHAQQPVVPDELLKEYLRLVECMLSDYRDSNYGDAQRWIRHIAEASDAFEEKHGLSPWEMARKNFRAATLSGGKP